METENRNREAGSTKGGARSSRLPLTACRFSVLICTYNRPDLLAQCLDALICRTTEQPDEIVVVNGGDERTDEVVAEVSGKRQAIGIEIKLIKTVNKNLAASRNVGLPHCTGDIIAMTDDDAEVFADWVTQMKRLHAEHPEAGVVGGAVVGAASDSYISRLADRVTFSSPEIAQYVRTLPGVNVSYKRAVVDGIGPQDESLFRGEDVDYNWRAKRLGYEVYYDPAVRVLHHHRPTLRRFLNQHYMYGRAYYLVRSKWPDMYCVYPHALRTPKDVLKAFNFIAAPFYEPLQYAAKLESLGDRLRAYPVLFANQLAWRGGMLRQKLSSRPREDKLSHGYPQINTDIELKENSQ
ncbi:MAG: glycosyltransferase family 2 protein [Acidobacteriota bacterium]